MPGAWRSAMLPDMEVRHPHDGEWIRVRPGTENRAIAYLVWDVATGHYFRIAPELESELKDHPGVQEMLIVQAMNDAGEHFLWPVPTPVTETHPIYAAMERWV